MIAIVNIPIIVRVDPYIRISDTSADRSYDVDAFEITHHLISSVGMFMVNIKHLGKDNEKLRDLSLTMGYNDLKELYASPASVLTSIYSHYMYDINKACGYQVTDEHREFKHVNLDAHSTVYNIPSGFTVVQYTNKDGTIEDIVAYCTDPEYKITEEDMIALDNALGVGNYKLLSTEAAEIYINEKEKKLEKAEEEAKLTKEEVEKPGDNPPSFDPSWIFDKEDFQ